jgi:uncharacterized membrane protein
LSEIAVRITEGLAKLKCWAFTAALSSSAAGIPVWLRAFFIAMVPILELRGAIPLAHNSWGMPLPQAYIWAVIGNMVPIPFVLLFLEPVSDWLRKRSDRIDRFFTWLFARTRRKHSKTFERWRDVALCVFVGIPLPGTGAWSGALAAFVFDVPFWPALIAIFGGVLLAGGAVTVVILYFETFPLWLTLLSAVLMAAVLIIVWLRGRREREETNPEAEGIVSESPIELELED